MRKQLLIIASILLWVASANAQILNYSVLSEKIYANNTRICYFEITEILSQKERMFLQTNIINSEKILRLHFFNSNQNVFMFESLSTWNVDSVVFFFNGLLSQKEEIDIFSNEEIDALSASFNRDLPCSDPLEQPNGCIDAAPFCTNLDEYCFPGSVGVASLGTFGCLISTPNPAWYWMELDQPGDMDILISSNSDVDFIAWGPFTSVEDACLNKNILCNSCPYNNLPWNVGSYPHGNIVDCSFSGSATEILHIRSAEQGQVYLLLITNYFHVQTNIKFSKVGSGTATTNCGIVTPPTSNNGPLCLGDTLKLTAQTSNVEGTQYHWSGPNGFISNTQNPIIPNVTMLQAGTYTLKITANDQEGDPKTTDVEINKPSFTTIYDTICANGFYEFNDSIYYSQGTYYHNFQNAVDCDSIVTLQLTVHRTDSTSFTENICIGENYFFCGNSLTTQGIYDTTLHNIHGCDSTVILTLKVNPVYNNTFNDTICEGKTYIFGEEKLTAAGSYTRNPGTVTGCDSILNLQLYMLLTEFSISPPDEICADAPSFCVPIDLRGSEMMYYNVHFDPDTQEQQFEKFRANITNRDCLEIIIPNNPNDRRDYVKPNNYTAYIYVNDEKCNSSTLEVPFQILYPNWIFEQKWNDVLALLNDKYNGGYLFSKYEWYKNDTPLGASGSYVRVPVDINPDTEYRVRLTRMNEEKAIFTCPINLEYRSYNKVYPQFLLKNEFVNVETQQDGVVEVWNLLGIKLAQYPVFVNQVNKIPLNVSGFLLLEVIQNNGHRQTFKVVVH